METTEAPESVEIPTEPVAAEPADPTSAYHRSEFDPARRTILFCASGGRSALAAETLQTLGYTRVAHIRGGLKAWREAGLRVEPHA